MNLCLIPKMSLSKESKDADRGANWSYEETITLINIWSDTNIQEEFEKSRRNAPIFEKVAKKMIEAGYERNMVQCQQKINSLRSNICFKIRHCCLKKQELGIH